MAGEETSVSVVRANAFACDRRALLAGSGTGLILALAPAIGETGAGGPAVIARLAFFDDRPLIDGSGTLPAYHPPAGFRGAVALASLDEVQVRFLSPFMT